MKKPMIAVIDGKGGGLGKAAVESLVEAGLDVEIVALGTNAIATANMLRGGAKDGASGENPICHMAEKADVIVGPIAILMPDAIMGEVTERMAVSIAKSSAEKVLLPLQRCGIHVVGMGEITIKELMQHLPAMVKQALEEKKNA